MYVFVWAYGHQVPLGLEAQAAVNHLAWVLEPELVL